MVEKRSIAIVDDESTIRKTIEFAAQENDYAVSLFSDGQMAWDSFKLALPDLIILDIMMPRIDGLELCQKIRHISPQVPIIFLTSKDEEFDKVLGLELGADDYLCKPFSMRELMTRIKVLFRRITMIKQLDEDRSTRDDQLCLGDLCLNTESYRVYYGQKEIHFTITEFRLLENLLCHTDVVRSREQLLNIAFPFDNYVNDRTIDTHIKRIRRKFQTVDPNFSMIETVYGLGYRLSKESIEKERSKIL